MADELILLVDDEANIVQLARLYLEREGLSHQAVGMGWRIGKSPFRPSGADGAGYHAAGDGWVWRSAAACGPKRTRLRS